MVYHFSEVSCMSIFKIKKCVIHIKINICIDEIQKI